ncbi:MULTISPECIES: hypothetical protein [unclassified Pseudoalteromonas]|uniref:hypothetical protein n=1 Tax=unclassified Pseudoalteromonas TaxID=194690 RepID=UPI000A479300|nr:MULTISPECIES: hypothetical protein [unclassified Pseudoalteromonas]
MNSSAIGFESGVGYWNQSSEVWPDHIFAGDVRKESYYKLARNSSGAAVTEPYFDSIDY